MQSDMFEHPINARLMELRSAIASRESEIEEIRSEMRDLTSTLRGIQINEEGTASLLVGPGKHRHFLIAKGPRGDRIFLPISLDLLARAVEEFRDNGPKNIS